jgi:hypothetical protein
MGLNEITFMCSVKPYDILEVKNALVKSVYCVTERNNRGIVIYRRASSTAS